MRAYECDGVPFGRSKLRGKCKCGVEVLVVPTSAYENSVFDVGTGLKHKHLPTPKPRKAESAGDLPFAGWMDVSP